MAKSLYNVVQNCTKVVVSGTKYLSLSGDKVITIDNQSWISIHAYVLVDWEQVPLLLRLELLMEGSNAAHITKVIINVMVRDGSLCKRLGRGWSVLVWMVHLYCRKNGMA
jgi:hypothetical protein